MEKKQREIKEVSTQELRSIATRLAFYSSQILRMSDDAEAAGFKEVKTRSWPTFELGVTNITKTFPKIREAFDGLYISDSVEKKETPIPRSTSEQNAEMVKKAQEFSKNLPDKATKKTDKKRKAE